MYCSSRLGGLKGQLSDIDNYNPLKATSVVCFDLAGAGQWYACLGSVVLNKAAGSIALVKQVSNCAPSTWRATLSPLWSRDLRFERWRRRPYEPCSKGTPSQRFSAHTSAVERSFRARIGASGPCTCRLHGYNSLQGCNAMWRPSSSDQVTCLSETLWSSLC